MFTYEILSNTKISVITFEDFKVLVKNIPDDAIIFNNCEKIDDCNIDGLLYMIDFMSHTVLTNQYPYISIIYNNTMKNYIIIDK